MTGAKAIGPIPPEFAALSALPVADWIAQAGGTPLYVYDLRSSRRGSRG